VDKKYTTISASQTQKIGERLAEEVLNLKPKNSAVVLALKGNLGAGKTTFLQGFAKGLGLHDKILSPTFVILKHFEIVGQNFENFYHIDCYRINSKKDISELGLKEILYNPKNIVAIEWPEKIKSILPKDVIGLDFKFIDNRTRELITK
jgi:tRNA threonylcarbamoyladenosine biosynthesis protein TsaE